MPLGEDPDPRMTLANERTFLAWNRTALALIAAGLAAGQVLDFDSSAARLVISLPPVVLGATLAALSLGRWRRNEHALRHGEPIALDGPYRLLTWGLVTMATVAAVVVVAEAL
jgi:putative membrane protein